MAKQQPEALAEFAEAARHQPEGKVDKKHLTADRHNKPIPTENAKKHDAATRVLNEGATGKDEGSREAIDDLPDRITESR